MSVATRYLGTPVSIPAFERRAITTLADDQCEYDRCRLGDSGVTLFRETRTWLAAQRYLTQRISLRSRAALKASEAFPAVLRVPGAYAGEGTTESPY